MAAEMMRPSIFRALPGFPFLPCPICRDEGFANAVESCDHTVRERATRTHPGLVLRSGRLALSEGKEAGTDSKDREADNAG